MILWNCSEKQPMSPKEPRGLPRKVPPLACATSSTTLTPRRCAISTILSIFAGIPRMCTTMTAFVRGVIFFSKSAGSMVRDPSTSATMGIARAATTDAHVAKKVYEGTITSSPGPTPIATSAEMSADVQEFMARACFVPTNDAYRSSRALTFDGDSFGP